MLWIARLIFLNRCFILDYRDKKVILVTMLVYNRHANLHFGDIAFFHLMVQFKQVRRLPNLHLPLINKNLLLVQPEVVCPKTLGYSDSFEQYEFLDKIQTNILNQTKTFVFVGVPTSPQCVHQEATPTKWIRTQKIPTVSIPTCGVRTW